MRLPGGSGAAPFDSLVGLIPSCPLETSDIGFLRMLVVSRRCTVTANYDLTLSADEFDLYIGVCVLRAFFMIASHMHPRARMLALARDLARGASCELFALAGYVRLHSNSSGWNPIYISG